MRTYGKADWLDSLGEWDRGKFGDEWKPYRHRAAMRGMIYPPTGSRWDSWEDDEPSQRAIVVRAIRETPDLLRRSIDRSRSWSEVVATVIHVRDQMRDDLDRHQRELAYERDEPDQHEATVVLKRILERIGNS